MALTQTELVNLKLVARLGVQAASAYINKTALGFAVEHLKKAGAQIGLTGDSISTFLNSGFAGGTSAGIQAGLASSGAAEGIVGGTTTTSTAGSTAAAVGPQDFNSTEAGLVGIGGAIAGKLIGDKLGPVGPMLANIGLIAPTIIGAASTAAATASAAAVASGAAAGSAAIGAGPWGIAAVFAMKIIQGVLSGSSVGPVGTVTLSYKDGKYQIAGSGVDNGFPRDAIIELGEKISGSLNQVGQTFGGTGERTKSPDIEFKFIGGNYEVTVGGEKNSFAMESVVGFSSFESSAGGEGGFAGGTLPNDPNPNAPIIEKNDLTAALDDLFVRSTQQSQFTGVDPLIQKAITKSKGKNFSELRDDTNNIYVDELLTQEEFDKLPAARRNEINTYIHENPTVTHSTFQDDSVKPANFDPGKSVTEQIGGSGNEGTPQFRERVLTAPTINGIPLSSFKKEQTAAGAAFTLGDQKFILEEGKAFQVPLDSPNTMREINNQIRTQFDQVQTGGDQELQDLINAAIELNGGTIDPETGEITPPSETPEANAGEAGNLFGEGSTDTQVGSNVPSTGTGVISQPGTGQGSGLTAGGGDGILNSINEFLNGAPLDPQIAFENPRAALLERQRVLNEAGRSILNQYVAQTNVDFKQLERRYQIMDLAALDSAQGLGNPAERIAFHATELMRAQIRDDLTPQELQNLNDEFDAYRTGIDIGADKFIKDQIKNINDDFRKRGLRTGPGNEPRLSAIGAEIGDVAERTAQAKATLAASQAQQRNLRTDASIRRQAEIATQGIAQNVGVQNLQTQLLAQGAQNKSNLIAQRGATLGTLGQNLSTNASLANSALGGTGGIQPGGTDAGISGILDTVGGIGAAAQNLFGGTVGQGISALGGLFGSNGLQDFSGQFALEDFGGDFDFGSGFDGGGFNFDFDSIDPGLDPDVFSP